MFLYDKKKRFSEPLLFIQNVYLFCLTETILLIAQNIYLIVCKYKIHK